MAQGSWTLKEWGVLQDVERSQIPTDGNEEWSWVYGVKRNLLYNAQHTARASHSRITGGMLGTSSLNEIVLPFMVWKTAHGRSSKTAVEGKTKPE
jgi:hypothetical protein